MKKLYTLVILLCVTGFAFAQNTITGNFPALVGQQVRLVGFDGFGIYTIDSTLVSQQGEFKLNYADKDRGMGYLAAEDNKAYFVVLASEDLQLIGDLLSVTNSVSTLYGNENQLFAQYALEHSKREQALSAWIYLRKIYQSDSLFAIQKRPNKEIDKEILRIKQEDLDFLNNLEPNSYIRWYLPVRKLVSSVSTVAQYRTEEIPATINAFRNLDYSDKRLYKSGLYKDVIDSHFWLLENMGQPLDTVYKEMSISIDFMLENLPENEKKFNEITKYLFNLLERHSLFQASEYLALSLLTQNSCTLNDDLANQLESYRAMKIGNTAPDIEFRDAVFAPSYETDNSPQKLSEIKKKYTLILFGASWCPQCPQELAQIAILYEKWKKEDLEVVFVSLDEDEQTFNTLASAFPFISTCDYQKWESSAVQAYHVFATPSLFLLDDKQEIILRPNSVSQMDAWVDFYLRAKQ